jgi:hypothetical protein
MSKISEDFEPDKTTTIPVTKKIYQQQLDKLEEYVHKEKFKQNFRPMTTVEI